jgi:methyl-accepting chemotaxis protein
VSKAWRKERFAFDLDCAARALRRFLCLDQSAPDALFLPLACLGDYDSFAGRQQRARSVHDAFNMLSWTCRANAARQGQSGLLHVVELWFEAFRNWPAPQARAASQAGALSRPARPSLSMALMRLAAFECFGATSMLVRDDTAFSQPPNSWPERLPSLAKRDPSRLLARFESPLFPFDGFEIMPRNFKIGVRLAVAFGVLVFLTLALAAFAVHRMGEASAVVDAERRIRLTQLAPLYELREALDQTGIAARNAYIYEEQADAERELDVLDQQSAIFLDRLGKLATVLGGTPDFDTAHRDLKLMAGALQKPREFRKAGQMKEFGRFLVQDCSPLRRRIVAELDLVIQRIEGELSRASREVDQVGALSVKWMYAISAFAVFLGALLGHRVTQGITRPLAQASTFAEAVATGDLSAPLPPSSRDEIGAVMASLGNMREGLVGIVGGVRLGAQDISLTSQEIASGNQDLSARTESQASSLQQTAAAMVLLTEAVGRNAIDAKKANALASEASSIAERGGAIVGRVTHTMGAINQASSRIVDVIGVIDSIAFQTNILALNAAVEAARAGEQGRGFAVVATEVRALAHRSATAAREVKALIETSVQKIHDGGELVDQSGKTMEELAASVRSVSSLIERISTASDSQAASVNEINQAVKQIDDLTQQNAALVEQAAAAAESMSQRALELSGQVKVFQLAA